MKAQRLPVTLILLAAIALGALREFLLINLNYCIDHQANHRAVNYAHSAFRNLVEGLSLRGLEALKWCFSLLFIALTLGLAILLARTLFGDHRYTRWLVLGFAGVGAVALLLQLAATAAPALALVSVKLIHLLQYPVVLFFIWAATWLQRRSI